MSTLRNGVARAAAGLHGLPVLLLSLTALFWAGNAIAGQLTLGRITPVTLTFLRWVIVSAMLWPLYGHEVRAHWPLIRPRLGRIMLMALLGFTGFNLLFYAASRETSAVNVGILQGSIPVFVLLGAFVVHGARFSALQGLGVLGTMIGVALVATRGQPLLLLETQVNRGDLLMLCACALYAFYAVALKDRPIMPGRAFFTLLAVIAAVAALPAAIAETALHGLQAPSAEGWLLTLYVAVFPSCLAQLFFLRGVDLIGPGRAGVFVNLVPVFAAILAVALLGQRFETYHGVALALVIGGIWLAQRPVRAPITTPTAEE